MRLYICCARQSEAVQPGLIVRRFYAVDQRSARQRDAAGILPDLGVGVEPLDRHFEIEPDAIALLPSTTDRGIAVAGDICQPNRLAIDHEARLGTPSRYAQMQREFDRRLRFDRDLDGAIPGI